MQLVDALPKRILVTGAAGLVGRAVSSLLMRLGVDVVPLVKRAGAGYPGEIVFDLADVRNNLSGLVQPAPDAVVHLAAAVPHWSRYPDNEENAAATRLMDRRVAAAARTWGARLIYMSTCGLYDPTDDGWKVESCGTVARSPYFSAKADGEAMALAVSGVVLRLSAPYGAGMSQSLVLPRFVEAVRRDDTIEVWGSGAREQDFIAVEDVAEAVVAALRVDAAGIFNVAQGRPISMHALAKLVIDAIGGGQLSLSGRADPLDGHTARYRIEKAKSLLGWYPQHDLATDLKAWRRQDVA